MDVFFVISGYLITCILVREMNDGTYSVFQFYERRMRRLMPALLAMMFCVTAVCIPLLLPADLINYAQSIIATFLFASNIFFWRTAGYFDADAGTKPLLHTWSLGVEEQFYIFFPLILRILFIVRNRQAFLGLLIGLTSLSYAIDVTSLYFSKSFVAFYLLPMRAWEMGMGAIAAQVRGPINSKLGILGFVLLWIALTSPALLPGIVPDATLACLATSILILAGGRGTGGLLSTRPMVWLGLISYSLYLWHWPLFVLVGYVVIRPLTLWESAGVTVLSLVLAILSWRYVETPFRRAMPSRRVLMLVGAGALLLSITAAVLLRRDGLPGRFHAISAAFNRVDGTHYRCPVTDYMTFGPFYACPVNLPDHDVARAEVVVLGNSHAQMYVPAIWEALQRRGLHGLLVPVSGCAPFVHFNTSENCISITHSNREAVMALPHARVVILSFAWHKLKEPMVDVNGRPVGTLSWSQIRAEISATISALQKAGKRVILVGPIPFPGYYVASVVSREIAYRGRALSPLEQSRAFFDSHMGIAIDWVRRGPLDTIPAIPSDLLCDLRRCNYIAGGAPIYADDNHLSALAMPLFVPMFGDAIDRAERSPVPAKLLR